MSKEFEHILSALYFLGPGIVSDNDAEFSTAKDYLEKYWLDSTEYLSFWRPIQEKIFNGEALPDMVFREGYSIIALRGGSLFSEEDYKKLQECFKHLQARNFVVIQYGESSSVVRLKFPVGEPWEKVFNGTSLCEHIFQAPINSYYVFPDNPGIGKYANNDYISPLDLVACADAYIDVCKSEFLVDKAEFESIRDYWLPATYEDRILENYKR